MGTFNLLAPNHVCAAVGTRINRSRLNKNLSQQQLADMTGASLSSIRRLEASGQSSFELVVRVSQALHMADAWESLFVAPVESIADAERAARGHARKRARVVSTLPARKK